MQMPYPSCRMSLYIIKVYDRSSPAALPDAGYRRPLSDASFTVRCEVR